MQNDVTMAHEMPWPMKDGQEMSKEYNDKWELVFGDMPSMVLHYLQKMPLSLTRRERQGCEHQTGASMMMTNRDAGCNEEMSINIAVKILNRKPWSRALNPLGWQVYSPLVTSLLPSDDKVYCGQTYHSQPKWLMTIGFNGNVHQKKMTKGWDICIKCKDSLKWSQSR